MVEVVVVCNLLIGIVEVIQGVVVGITEVKEVLATNKQTTRELELLEWEGMYLAQDVEVPESGLDGQFHLICHL